MGPKPKHFHGVRPHNEVRFLLNLLGYEILHLGRVLMEQATGASKREKGTVTSSLRARSLPTIPLPWRTGSNPSGCFTMSGWLE